MSFATRLRSLPHARAWSLAWPMIVSNMSVPLMGLADTAMLGHLESPIFLGAVAIGSNIIAMLYWMFAFLRMGTTSVTARALGAEKPALAMLHFSQNSQLALLLGAGLIVLQSLLIPLILWLIAPDPELLEIAKEYCAIRIYSAPAVLATYVAMGWLIGLNNPKIPLIITVAANLLNIALDYLFIVQWQYDAAGAATASLIAEYTAMVMAWFFVWKTAKEKQWAFRWAVDAHYLRNTLSLNADLFIRTITLLFVINFFNAQSAYLGNDVLAANAILFQGILFVAFFLDGYALAGETMTAQAIGRKNVMEFHEASAVTSITALGIAILLSAAFYSLGKPAIMLLTDIAAVASIAVAHLSWLVLMPMIGVWCYAFDGIFIGAGQSRLMRNSMLFSAVVGFFPAWWLFRFWGNHGLWFAFIIFNAFRGATLAYAYYYSTRKHLWLNKSI